MFSRKYIYEEMLINKQIEDNEKILSRINKELKLEKMKKDIDRKYKKLTNRKYI
jgi:hypothetical protein